MARTSKTMLNYSDENGHPCLVPVFRGNAFSFSTLRIRFAVGLSYTAFICWDRSLLCRFLKSFIINHCWIFHIFHTSANIVNHIDWLTFLFFFFLAVWFRLGFIVLKFFKNFFKFYFILLYNIVLVLLYIDMIHHRCTWVPNPEPPSHHPPHIISLGHPSAPAPSILYPVSNLDWRFVSYMIVYMFQCHSP